MYTITNTMIAIIIGSWDISLQAADVVNAVDEAEEDSEYYLALCYPRAQTPSLVPQF